MTNGTSIVRRGAWCIVLTLVLVSVTRADSLPPTVVAVASVDSVEPTVAELRGELLVTLRAPQALLRDAARLRKAIVPFFDGEEVQGLPPPRVVLPDSVTALLTYALVENNQTRAVWSRLAAARHAGEFTTTRIDVSVGPSGGAPVATDVAGDRAITLRLFDRRLLLGCGIAFVALLAGFIVLAIRSDLLRDSVGTPVPGVRRPYSLARLQMSLWFFAILGAFLFLWVVTGRLDTVNESLVGLMGISAVTGVGALLIDSAPARRNRPTEHEWFLIDVLSDADGVSLHRVQVLAWTVALLVVFVRSVVTLLVVPEFSASLLLLTGVSAGTYLGYKYKE